MRLSYDTNNKDTSSNVNDADMMTNVRIKDDINVVTIITRKISS
jgi:hypothetical protein